MYITYRYFYKSNSEDAAIDCTSKDWDSLDKAIAYAHRYSNGLRFESCEIEDAEGRVVYRLLQDSTIEDFTDSNNQITDR